MAVYDVFLYPGMMQYTCSEGQTTLPSTDQAEQLRRSIIVNGCYVFVNVLKATSYVIGKRAVSSPNVLLHTTAL